MAVVAQQVLAGPGVLAVVAFGEGSVAKNEPEEEGGRRAVPAGDRR
jgi:hypothetical protein